jgi:hypothetical protein
MTSLGYLIGLRGCLLGISYLPPGIGKAYRKLYSIFIELQY